MLIISMHNSHLLIFSWFQLLNMLFLKSVCFMIYPHFVSQLNQLFASFDCSFNYFVAVVDFEIGPQVTLNIFLEVLCWLFLIVAVPILNYQAVDAFFANVWFCLTFWSGGIDLDWKTLWSSSFHSGHIETPIVCSVHFFIFSSLFSKIIMIFWRVFLNIVITDYTIIINISISGLCSIVSI